MTVSHGDRALPKARELGEALRGARKQKGLSARSVADRLGVSHVTILNYESGRSVIPDHLLDRLKIDLCLSNDVLRLQQEAEDERKANRRRRRARDLFDSDGPQAILVVEDMNDDAINLGSGRKLIVGGDYVVNSYELTYYLPSVRGAPLREEATREITALRDGLDAWRGSTRTWLAETDKGEATSLTLIRGPEGAQLSVTHEKPDRRAPAPGRVYVAEVRFPQRKKGERVRFTTLLSHPTNFDQWISHKGSIGWRGFPPIKTSVEHVSLTICFPREHIPEQIWHYGDLPDWDTPGKANETNVLKVDDAGLVAFSWGHLLRGYTYGIAWKW